MYRKKKNHGASAVVQGEEFRGWRRCTLHEVQPEMASRMFARHRDTDRQLTGCQLAKMSTFTTRKAFRGAISYVRRTELWKLNAVSPLVKMKKVMSF